MEAAVQDVIPPAQIPPLMEIVVGKAVNQPALCQLPVPGVGGEPGAGQPVDQGSYDLDTGIAGQGIHPVAGPILPVYPVGMTQYDKAPGGDGFMDGLLVGAVEIFLHADGQHVGIAGIFHAVNQAQLLREILRIGKKVVVGYGENVVTGFPVTVYHLRQIVGPAGAGGRFRRGYENWPSARFPGVESFIRIHIHDS